MQANPKTKIYIDGSNLHKGMNTETYELDYAKFYRYLFDSYKPSHIYIFLGFVSGRQPLYDYLTHCGYHLIFKETFQHKDGEVKGNIDGELIVQCLEDHYEDSYELGILISGDGDFACLIDFWKRKNVKIKIFAPNKKNCSYLLKKHNVPLVFLNHERLLPKITKIKKDP